MDHDGIKNLLLALTVPFLILINAAWIGLALEKLFEKFKSVRFQTGGTEALMHAASKPIKWLVFGYALLVAGQYLANYFSFDLSPFYPEETKKLFLLALLTWMAFRWKWAYEKHLIEKHKDDSKEKFSLIIAVSRLVSVLIFTVAGLMFLDILHIPIGALLAFGGIGGLALGWAAQGLISNLFGGLLIYMNRPFGIGDWIASPNKHFEGIVEEIGWVQTRLRTLDRRPIFIPNSLITDAIIENPGRMYNRRIKSSFSLTYQDIDKLEVINKDIEEILNSHPDIDKKQQLLVKLVQFTPSALEIEVYCFTKGVTLQSYRTTLQEILLKIAEVVKARGAHFAYPTSTVYNH